MQPSQSQGSNQHRPVRSQLARRASVSFVFLAAVSLLAGCLGPDEFDPTGTAPIGSLDVVEASGSSIRVIGWAIDPDTTAPIDVSVSSRQVATGHRADLPRPDVAAVHRSHGPFHGFDARTQPLPPGLNQVCVWVDNVGRGSQARLLGCRDVVTGSDDPTGAFDAVQQIGPDRVRVSGWAHDPDAGRSSDVSVTVDGAVAGRFRADRAQPDVSSFVRSNLGHGFVADLDAPVGNRTICVAAENLGGGVRRQLGCKNLHVDSVPWTGAGGDISSVAAVGPGPQHPLHRIDRDAGASTTLRDGSVLWFFGDSSEMSGSGFAYFVNNTAAWAPASNPAQTRDGVAPGRRPFTFALPVTGFPGGCPSGWSPVLWPMSAVNVPVAPADQRDRVIVFLVNICLNGTNAQSRGVSVAEFLYDPASPPDGRQVTGTVVNQSLFPVDTEYGTASMVIGGRVHAYQCGRPSDTRPPGTIVWPDDPVFDGCTVARVDPAGVANPAMWRYWTGGNDWSARSGDAAKMVMPGDPSGDRFQPVASFSIVEDPHHGFTMVYSPWPGYTDRLFIRSGASPTGPWTLPSTVRLPGCFDRLEGQEQLCYAGTAQPWRSTPTELGVGWFDQFRYLDPARGGYVAGSTASIPRR